MTGKKMTVMVTPVYLIYSVSRKLSLTVIKTYGAPKIILITDCFTDNNIFKRMTEISVGTEMVYFPLLNHAVWKTL